ncbi:ATP-binding cassette domain-containing protein [Micromonospora sp. WMMA1363]|uniref:ATP-binding cassette domain-containing protein n=1 Tax=Micromonospora sp. WMMA1363 TaxID=3053985 RepID=UPI00259D2586|nr:ATP-binding cassette domain-containing protein [Micromonospora sp. WMMA1363]MDM4723080.1 ATP-binding cassette domain-containing protein [Micromonospora sp. WMMA1363]
MGDVVVEARGLGMRTRRGWVFRDVDLTAARGELHAVIGLPGSGRTSLLLALAGRFPTTHGRLLRHGPAALGHVPGVHEPDPALTVAEHIRERLLLLGPVPRRRRQLVPMAALRARRAYRRDAYATAISGADLTGDLPFDPATRGRDLTPLHRQVLGLVLATLSGPALIVADDVDAGSDPTERAWLWATLAHLADQGYAVLATARALELGTPAVVHRLGDPSAHAIPGHRPHPHPPAVSAARATGRHRAGHGSRVAPSAADSAPSTAVPVPSGADSAPSGAVPVPSGAVPVPSATDAETTKVDQ